jgi:hypothetical protein
MSVSRELVRAVQIMVNRENNGEHVPEGWEEYSEDAVVTIAANPPGTVYVNVYVLDRVCGGQEEGGWYFDTGDVELSVVCDSDESANERAALLADVYEDNRNRYSVIYYSKSPDFEIRVEYTPAAAWPVAYPHYE